jgi:hypothetical protein
MHASCRHRRRRRLPSRAGDGARSGSPSADEVITPRRFSSAAKPVMPRCKLLENAEYVRTRGGVSGSQRDYLSALFDSVTFALYGALQIGSVAYFRHDRQARCVSSGNLLQRNSIAPLALGRGRYFWRLGLHFSDAAGRQRRHARVILEEHAASRTVIGGRLFGRDSCAHSPARFIRWHRIFDHTEAGGRIRTNDKSARRSGRPSSLLRRRPFCHAFSDIRHIAVR